MACVGGAHPRGGGATGAHPTGDAWGGHVSLEIACSRAPALRSRTHTHAHTLVTSACVGCRLRCAPTITIITNCRGGSRAHGGGARKRHSLPPRVDGGLVPTALTTHATSTPHPQGRALSVRAHANKKLVQKAEYIWSDGQEGMPNKGLLFNELRSKTKTFDADQGMDASKWVRGTSAQVPPCWVSPQR